MTSSPAPDGAPIKTVILSNTSGMHIALMDIGATWFSCVLPFNDGDRDVLLCSPNVKVLHEGGAYFGPIVGRYANRIANSEFSLHQKNYALQANEGKHCLHGGLNGYERRRWSIESLTSSSVVFSLSSPALDQGFPGQLEIQAEYLLTNDNQVMIRYQAVSDEDTFVNLTNHAYFNLMGESSGCDILTHKLQIKADHYLPTNEALIPTGQLKPVDQTGFDFRQAKMIGQHLLEDEDQQYADGYDHCFIFSDQTKSLTPVANLSAPDDSVHLSVLTTKPALQLYVGQGLSQKEGKQGLYKKHSGLALETQFLPDGPNHPEWEGLNGFLRAKTRYEHQTVYHFEY